MTSSRVAAGISLILGLTLPVPGASGQGALQSSEERALATGQTDRFSAPLKKDQFLSIAVVQKGIDVGITVLDPEGAQIRFVDGADGIQGTESITVVVEF